MADETPFDLANRIATLAKGDAGHVILAFAIMDQLLETLLLTYLPKLPDARAVKLFSHRGPLGSFGAKKTFAYVLGLVNDETVADLNGIRTVRNAFAHPRGFLHFASPEVAEVFAQIKQWPSGGDLKALFDSRVSRAAKAIEAKIHSLIYAAVTR